MYKLVSLNVVDYNQYFYMPELDKEGINLKNGFEKIYVMHYGCPDLYGQVVLGKPLLDNQSSKHHVTIFEKDTQVYIKVPNPKYRDIGHNERFKWMGNEYLKIDTLSEGKLLYFAINLNSGTIVDFSRDDEVERV